MEEREKKMQTKDRKPGFSDRNPYDLSQSGLSIGAQRSEKERVRRTDAQASSYNMSKSPRRDVIKRIKLRSA